MTDLDNNSSQPADQVTLDGYAEALLKDAKRFDVSALERSDRIVKRMTIITLGACAVAAVAVVVAIVATMSVREVQPYVMMIDESRGTAQELVKVESEEWTHGQAMDASYLGQYVRAREEYSDAQALFNYEQVELMSSGPVMAEYRQWIDPESNKLSPMALYPRGIVDIEITGVVRMGRGAAQVHYRRNVKGVPNPPKPISYIATIEFSYLTKNMTLAARVRNGLGFTVSSYSVDESVVGTTVQPMQNAAGGER